VDVKSRLTILISATLVDLMTSTGHSLLLVIFCRSLNSDAQILRFLPYVLSSIELLKVLQL